MNAHIVSNHRLPGPSSNVFGFDLLRAAKNDYLAHIDALKAQFGDVVMSQVGHEKIVDIHHPELIRALLVDHADALIRWERGIEVFANIHGQSVLVTEGDTWKRQRRMLQPGFSAKRMQGYCSLMQTATHNAMAALDAAPEIEIEFGRWAHQFTMDVILQTLFSRSAPEIRDEAIAAVATLSRVGMAEMFWPMSAPDWMPQKRAKRDAKQVLDTLIRSNVSRRRQEARVGDAPTDDVLAMLLSVRDEIGDGYALGDEEIRDQCMSIFLAGHETTALALTWWAWLMAEHPHAMTRAQAEIDEVLAGERAHYEKLPHLRYLGWSLKEALRLYPPASGLISRRTLREIALGDWTIQKGAMVRISPWTVHRDARWFPEPERFLPERFDEATPLVNRQAFMPFGTGPRVCIGSHFALTEMSLIAATILQQFSLRSRAAPRPKLDVLLYPEGGMPMQWLRRARSA
jgi:cytochrome P450